MTKRIARLAVLGAAVAAFALPASPAQAEGCINMGTTPVQCLLEQIAVESPDVQQCYRLGTFVYECLPAVS